jgi:disulfide oxidoreductase YuzD
MLPLSENTVQITIINDSRRVECEVGCGTDWSSPDALALASQRTRERFGEEIKPVYIDLAEDTSSQDALKWSKEISEKDLSLPLLLVNGQVRISGQFDIRQLLDTVEVVIEIGV